MSCTPQKTSSWTAASLLGFLPYRSTYFLDYAIPPYSSSPFRYTLPYSPISYGWRPHFLACSLLYTWYLVLTFQLSHVSICFKWGGWSDNVCRPMRYAQHSASVASSLTVFEEEDVAVLHVAHQGRHLVTVESENRSSENKYYETATATRTRT